MDRIFAYHGRAITAEELTHMRTVIETHWAQGRTAISKVLCHDFGWTQPNGYLRDQWCRQLLVRLARAGCLTLPPQLKPDNNAHRRPRFQLPLLDQTPVEGPLAGVGPVTLRVATTPGEVAFWRNVMHAYHPQGCARILGAKLHYLAFAHGQVLALLGWGGAAWAVAARDRWIGWDAATRRHHLRGVVNNVRFLILPWVQVKYLASHLLAQCAQRLPGDWLRCHGYPLYLLETFVDPTRFQGTCYKAANWVGVGETTSPRRARTKATQPGHPKRVFCYPLVPDFRERLRGAT